MSEPIETKVNGADHTAENIPTRARRRRMARQAPPPSPPNGPPASRPTVQLVVPPELAARVHASQAAIQLAEAQNQATAAVLQTAQIARQNELVNVADQMGLRPSEVVNFDTQPNGAVVLTAYAKET